MLHLFQEPPRALVLQTSQRKQSPRDSAHKQTYARGEGGADLAVLYAFFARGC